MPIVEPTTLKMNYTMNGVATLPFTFPIAQGEDIRVYSYDTVNGTEVLLAEVTDFTLAYTETDFPTTGSITLLDSALYNDTNFQVTITRDTERVQEYDMQFAQKMDPDQLEFEEDRQVMMVQDLNKLNSEAVRFPSSEVIEDDANFLPTKATRAGALLGFDDDGNFTTSADLLDEAVADATAAAEASATDAANSASAASTSETNAATSASNASTSETNAAQSASDAAASAATIPTFTEATALNTAVLGDGAGNLTNALYTQPRSFSAGQVGMVFGITGTGTVEAVEMSGGGGAWSANTSKTDNYTILEADLTTLVYLNSSVTTDKTFTLKATPTDGDTVWLCNQNEMSEARLTVSDGTDDILYLGLSDGVYKFTYSSVASAWIPTTA